MEAAPPRGPRESVAASTSRDEVPAPGGSPHPAADKAAATDADTGAGDSSEDDEPATELPPDDTWWTARPQPVPDDDDDGGERAGRRAKKKDPAPFTRSVKRRVDRAGERPGLRELPRDIDDLATGKVERLRRKRPERAVLEDDREGAVIPGVRNTEARAVYDARVARLREALGEGREDELAGGLFAARQLRLWRARNVTDFQAFAESVVGVAPGTCETLADRGAGAWPADRGPLPQHIVALLIRTEAALLQRPPYGRAELRPSAATGHPGITLELTLPADDVAKTVESLTDVGQAAAGLRRFLHPDAAGPAPRGAGNAFADHGPRQPWTPRRTSGAASDRGATTREHNERSTRRDDDRLAPRSDRWEARERDPRRAPAAEHDERRSARARGIEPAVEREAHERGPGPEARARARDDEAFDDSIDGDGDLDAAPGASSEPSDGSQDFESRRNTRGEANPFARRDAGPAREQAGYPPRRFGDRARDDAPRKRGFEERGRGGSAARGPKRAFHDRSQGDFRGSKRAFNDRRRDDSRGAERGFDDRARSDSRGPKRTLDERTRGDSRGPRRAFDDRVQGEARGFKRGFDDRGGPARRDQRGPKRGFQRGARGPKRDDDTGGPERRFDGRTRDDTRDQARRGPKHRYDDQTGATRGHRDRTESFADGSRGKRRGSDDSSRSGFNAPRGPKKPFPKHAKRKKP